MCATFPLRLVGKYLSLVKFRTISKPLVGHRPASCLFQLVAIELVEYEAYEKGFPYVSSHDLSDSIISSKDKSLVYSNSSVRRVFLRVFHSDQRSEFDELIREVHP